MRRSNGRRAAGAVLAAGVVVLAGLAGIPDRPAALSASFPVLVAAGDIEGCGNGAATAKVVNGIDGAVAAVGDNAYPSGSPSDYKQCYGPTWGQFKDRTHPVPGNHDYDQNKAAGYFGYFGAAAGTPGQGWYSYDVGTWHVVALNSNCDSVDCGAESRWLDTDLSAHPAACTLAYWHHPRFSSGSAGNNPTMNDFFKPLYDHGASVVLSGHDHDYERFAPQDPNGHLDPGGIRQFVVGTGGGALGSFFGTSPNSEIRNNHTFGVLVLTLRPDGYDWRFAATPGGGFTDSGSAPCSGAAPTTTSGPPAPAAPNSAPGAPPVATTAPPAAPAPPDTGTTWRADSSAGFLPPATNAPPAPSRPRTPPSSALSQGRINGAGTSSTTAPSPPATTASRPTAPPATDAPRLAGPNDAIPAAGPDVALVAAISGLERPRSGGRTPVPAPLALTATAALLVDGALLLYADGRLRARIRNRRLRDGKWLAARRRAGLWKGRGLKPRTISTSKP